MAKIVGFILFFFFFLIIYASLHLFVYWRITWGLELSRLPLQLIRWGFAVLALTFIVGEFTSSYSWSIPLLLTGYVWLGVLSVAFSVFFLEWLSDIAFSWQRGRAVLFSLIVIVLVSGFSLVQGTRMPRLRTLHLYLERLPQKLEGTTIVQISDLHLSFHTPIQWVQSLVGRVNRECPDIVVITGDIMDRDICRHQWLCAPLMEIRSTYGVFAVTGNHEYYTGMDAFEKWVRQTGIRVLNNESVTAGGGIQIIGIPDDEARRFHLEGPDLKQAWTNINPGLPAILLYHRPQKFFEAVSRGIDLQISGHTHAGQIPPLDLLVKIFFRYSYGLHRRGNAWIYTTCGTGTWGPPMRLFSRNEIVKFILHPTKK